MKSLKAITAIVMFGLLCLPASAAFERHAIEGTGYNISESKQTKHHVVKQHKKHKSTTAAKSRKPSTIAHAMTPSIQPHPAGCPSRAFCGCGTSLYVFGKNIRSLWLARNWFQFPRTSPAAGMVAVRAHHVMAIIKAHGDGTATVYDPNSGGHMTRIHRRSLAGYVIVNPRRSHYASAS